MDACAAVVEAVDRAAAAEFERALTHGAQTDAGAIGEGQADTVVGDLQVQAIGQSESDGARVGAGVADDVHERLLDDAVGGDLDGGRQWGQVLRGVDGDVEGLAIDGGGVLGGAFAQGGEETELVERGRAELIHKAADIADGRAQAAVPVVQQGIGGRVVDGAIAGGGGVQGERGP